MSRFMLPFIEKVVDVIGDWHCGFRAIAEFMGLTEKNHLMIRTHLIQELKDHEDDYVEVFAGEDRYNYILNGLHEGILRGVFQNFNPLCGRNPIETDLD